MAAYSIGFEDTNRRPWEKGHATIDTDAPGGDYVVQIRIADGGGGLSKAEIEMAVRRLLDRMRETGGPRF